ncbi:AAA family ATPase [Adhaeribacter swui]|uniref:AAA family ATPase n=1 Tax=Adhaeribacter swui TaxID=2086471 RepID=A0A7G7GC99_9BACT|nr:ATP-binding protein [Adhaeribacter swui]QNF34783.1 AAA family ATPase [Adhaeribacter swui]
MKRYFLSSIEIEGFRGINNELSPLKIKIDDKKVHSIFAPNASGKSSIYDALSYALKDEIPRLKALHSKEKSEDYYINKFHSTGNSIINLCFKPDDSSQIINVQIRKDRTGGYSITSPEESNIKEF